MPNDNLQEPTEDDIYLAKMTMDEVGADIDQHGHVAVTEDNRTQDPFTTKGSLANALDEALDYSNPNYDPTNESQGEVEGVTQDPQNEAPKSDTEIKPDDTTMDKAPEVPESMDDNKEKTTKDSLTEALDSVVAMDAVTEVPGEADDDAHHKWESDEIKKRVPKVPESIGGDSPDSNGLVYLDYTFTVDPSKYRSANYQPINNAADAQGGSEPALVTKEELFSSVTNDKVDEGVKVEEKVEEEPTAKEEKVAAKEANEEKAEHDSLGKPIVEQGGKEQTKEEKEAEDEAIAKGLIDFATFIDGSSFLCNDEVSGIDYSKIAMDAGPKKAPTKQTCKTTFAQCRAKNPLFCRFHGPKLLEKDIKTAISAALGKGCVVSVTKDKGNKNPLAFRLTVGCPPQMKKDVEQTIHWYMTNVPGISSPEEYKDLGNGKETTEFEMDVLKADEPPKKSETKAQVAEFEVEKAEAAGKKMPVVGETPPSVEKKAAKAEVSHKFGEEEPSPIENDTKEEQEETNPDEDSNDVDFSIENEFGKIYDDAIAKHPELKDELSAISQKFSNSKNIDEYKQALSELKSLVSEKTEMQQAKPNVDDNLKFSQMVDEAMNKGLFDIPEFKKGYDSINWDHTTYPDTASQIKALEKLMNETDWESKKPQPTEEEKSKKEFEDEFNAALGEYPEHGSGKDNDAKNIEINEAFTKAYIANDQEGMKSAIEAMKKLVADVKGEEGGEGKGDEIQDVLGVLSGLNHEIADFNISYDAMGAKNPTDIKISAYGDGDFGAMLNKVDSMLANVGYGVSGTNGNDMHIVEKGGGDAKKEAALGKVKEALKGTGYENGDLQYADFGDAGQEVYIANTDSGTLEAIINKDGEIVFGVHDDGGGTWANSAKEAIKNFEENYGGSANGGKNSSATSAKIKDVLGKGFEDGDQQIDLVKSLWDIVSEADSNDDLAKNIQATLLDFMELDEDGYPTIDKEVDVGDEDSPMIYAIHKIQSLVDKQEDGADDSKNAHSGFHYVDGAAQKMETEIKDLAQENPELMSGDDQVSALYYSAQSHLDYLNLTKQGLDEIDAKLKEMENGGFETGASGVVEKMALEDAKKSQQESYEDAKVNAEIAVKDFKAAMETAKKNTVDAIKGVNAKMVEDIVKTVARTIFPKGKPDGVDSVPDMIDELYDEMETLGKELLGTSSPAYASIKKNSNIGLGDKYKAVSSASLEFDAVVKDFKDKIDNANDKAKSKRLNDAVKDIGEKGQALKDAFAAYKNAVEMVKKDITAYADIQAAKKKLTEAEGNGDLSHLLNNPYKLGYEIEPLAHEAVSKYKKDYSTNDGFHFKWSVDYANNLILQLKNIETDEDGFSKTVPVESLENLKKSIDEVFGKHGLQVAYDGFPKAMADIGTMSFKVGAAQEKSSNEDTTPVTADEISDFVSKGFKFSPSYWESTIADILNPDVKAMKMDAGQVKQLKKAMEKFPPGNKIVSLLEEGMAKKGLGSTSGSQENTDSSKLEAAKAKVSAMSTKEKMEKSIPILKKKLQQDPKNEKWKKMLAQAQAYLANH